MSDDNMKCLVCQMNSKEVPLIQIHYDDLEYYICPGHLPVLIHHPEQLTGILPGAANITPPRD